MKVTRIRGFDGIRALAMMVVFLTHRSDYVHGLEIGGSAMWLFFVLSGFLIIGILHKDRQRVEAGIQTVPQALQGFMGRRVRRIFPAYYMALLTIVPLLVAYNIVQLDRHGSIMLFTYLTNIWIGTELLHWPKFIGHFWSLAIEEQFYLLIPFIALLTPSRYLRNVCIGIVVVGFAALFILTAQGLPSITVHTNSIVNFGLLAFGGVCRLSIRGDGSGMSNGRGSWLAISIMMIYFGINFIGHRLDVSQSLLHVTPLLAGWGLVAVAQNQQSWIVKWLEWGPLAWFGRLTYGFYIYHNLVSLNTIVPLLNAMGLTVAFPQFGAALISFFMSLGVAWLSYRYIEQPAMKSGKTRPAEAVAADVNRGSSPSPIQSPSPVQLTTVDHDDAAVRLAPGNKPT